MLLLQTKIRTKTVYVFALLSYLGNFSMLPLMNMLARAKGIENNHLLWWILFMQLVLSVTGDAGFGQSMISSCLSIGTRIDSRGPNMLWLSFMDRVGCVFMFITSAAEKSQLGATNGIAQSVGSLMRTVGPAR